MKKGKVRFLLVAVMALTMLFGMTGCVKPYNTPVFVEIAPNETAFLVPLEGETSNQASFDSEAFLAEAKIAAKRIQIPRKWIQTGRAYWSGKYVDTMRVIVVDRTQETREWVGGQIVDARSKDGIGFKVGVGVTGGIEEESAAKFLYKTSGSRTLADVMDKEVRNYIETRLIEEYARRTMDEINGNKGEVMSVVSSQAIDYFKKERGITLSNVGYKGDIVFDDPKVQEAMNARFTAQEEQKAEAIRRETAKNNSNAQIEVEKNIAEAEIEKAKGIAEANRVIQNSLSSLLIQKEWIDKWDGKAPYFMADGNGSVFQVPLDKK